MKYLVLLGRICFAAIFIVAAPGHFKAQEIAYAAHAGVPFASLAVPVSGLMALAGGLSIALGYRTKIGAWPLVLFLVPVTLTMHNFWAVTDPISAQLQMAMVMEIGWVQGGAP